MLGEAPVCRPAAELQLIAVCWCTVKGQDRQLHMLRNSPCRSVCLSEGPAADTAAVAVCCCCSSTALQL
jgi:hypothetical protein